MEHFKGQVDQYQRRVMEVEADNARILKEKKELITANEELDREDLDMAKWSGGHEQRRRP